MEINNPDYVDIIFEKSNKSYGAYDIRRLYQKNVLVALLISVLFFSFVLVLPKIYDALTPEEIVLEDTGDGILKPMDIKPLDQKKEEPPPPPAKIEPPKVDMKRFTEPEIKKDEQIEDDKKAVNVDSLEKSNAGQQNQKGNDFHTDIDDGEGSEGDVGDIVDDKIFEYAEEQPQFDGNVQAFLQKNLVYPPRSIKMGSEGVVWVKFIIEKDGSLSNVQVWRGVTDEALNQEAVRIVSLMKWKPGRSNGYAVRLRYQYKINFKLPK